MDQNMRAIRNFVFGLTRPKHRCNVCGHSWKPRGNSRSARCPSCRSEDIDLSTSAVFKLVAVGVLIIAGGIWAMWMPSSDQTQVRAISVERVDPELTECETRCKGAETFNNCVKKCMISKRETKTNPK